MARLRQTSSVLAKGPGTSCRTQIQDASARLRCNSKAHVRHPSEPTQKGEREERRSQHATKAFNRLLSSGLGSRCAMKATEESSSQSRSGDCQVPPALAMDWGM